MFGPGSALPSSGGKVDGTTGSAGGAACVRRSAHFAPWVCHGCAWPAQQSRMWCI